ncbi:MAG: glycosyltransferase family 4 protein [Candidatus Thiodiazotropha sp. (ex Epidulcina cf. delphinae)]|nr:glycosyltransferase family 4 protein [Candidatus Thiodiazotropha sp. (ex Epidulcina cf. delphinae)]
MPKPDIPELIYLGRSRLHRNRANLIQTLHTVAALTEIGIKTRLYLPPWHGNVTLEQRLSEMGIATRAEIRASQLLHRRWPATAFARFHKGMLRGAKAVYVRSPELSLGLASLGIVHHFEVHTLQPMVRQGALTRILDYHRQGLIEQLIPISHSAATALIEAGADRRRIHVSPSGVDLSAYQTIPPLDPQRLAQPRMVYLGRISRDRGFEILTHLAERAMGEMRLVGDCDEQLPDYPQLNYHPAVPHRQVPGLYAESELVLLPYQPDLLHADGISPMKLFEAMAAGRPVIASDIPPLREILQHGRNALLADPKDPLSWEGAVTRLMHDPELACKLAAQARQDADAYSWPNRASGIARAIGLRTH